MIYEHFKYCGDRMEIKGKYNNILKMTTGARASTAHGAIEIDPSINNGNIIYEWIVKFDIANNCASIGIDSAESSSNILDQYLYSMRGVDDPFYSLRATPAKNSMSFYEHRVDEKFKYQKDTMTMQLHIKEKKLIFWKNDDKNSIVQFNDIDSTVKYKFAVYLSGARNSAEIVNFQIISR